MSEIMIKLIYNLKTGKKDVLIDFVSDIDALPIEHERDHKKLVQELLGKGVLTPDELGEVAVRRLTTAPTTQHQEPSLEAPKTQAEQG
jgi:hypothetical protein